MLRTRTCGELRPSDIGKSIELAGWVRFSRDHGGVSFIDLADAYGIAQIVYDPEILDDASRRKVEEAVKSFGRESVIRVKGVVRERVPGTEDERNPTGAVEVAIQEAELLNVSRPIPFEIAEQRDSMLPSEDVRLRYRYLDLRRARMAANLRFRHRLMSAARRALDEQGFVEVETPVLVKESPEGARSFIVPSRTSPGEFYALPQSPQLYKQMLMVGGLDRYYQVARCFRDEDSRSDRQPEFTQIDLEMSFVDIADVQAATESMLASIWRSVYGRELETPFQRVSYHDAMHKYGTDAPDTRYGLELEDVTDLVRGSNYGIFNKVLEKGGRVECMNVKGELTRGVAGDEGVGRNEVDRLIEWAKGQGMGGLTWMRMTPEGLKSNIVRYFQPEILKSLEDRMGCQEGDLLLFLAGSEIAALKAGGELRRKLAKDLRLLEGKDHRFVWLVDCPLFQKDHATGQLEPFHHAFVRPADGLDGDVFSVMGLSYDLVLDGSEIGSGSIRCHDPEVQRRIFKIMGLSDERIEANFGFLLEALSYGAPPHGGIALGADRLTSILLGTESIREVIAFPKNKKFQSLVDSCPSPVEQSKLDELMLLSLAGEEDETPE